MAKNETKELSSSNEVRDDDSDDSEETIFLPPDGGWGWIVVFSSFMIHVIADGVMYTFGIFYVEFLKYFRESKGVTAWIASIMIGVVFTVGPIASALTNKYGCRLVAIAGSILSSFGLFVSIFTPNVIFLYFTIGICTGTGIGLMYLPAIVCVTCYFEKKRAFATGIAVCGSGFGTFALAPLTEWLVEYYGWKGAMMIISGLLLNCSVFGSLFRPLEGIKLSKKNCAQVHASQSEPQILCKKSKDNSMNNIDTNNEAQVKNKHSLFIDKNTLKPVQSHPDLAVASSYLKGKFSPQDLLMAKRRNSAFPRIGSPSPEKISGIYNKHSNYHQNNHHHHHGILYRKDIFYSGSINHIPEFRSSSAMCTKSITSIPKEFPPEEEWKILKCFHCPKEMRDAFHEMMDFSLLKNLVFLLFGLSNFFTNIGFSVPYVYIKDRAIRLGIAGNENASLLLSVIGIANTASRVILGYLSDQSWVNRLWLYNCSLTLCGISTALSSFSNTYILMAVYAAVFGATAGAYVSLTSVILVDLLGLDKLTNAFGLLLLFEGVASLIGPPITGWLYDGTGSYDPGFYVSGVMIAISGLMMFFIPCIQKFQKLPTQTSGQVQRV